MRLLGVGLDRGDGRPTPLTTGALQRSGRNDSSNAIEHSARQGGLDFQSFKYNGRLVKWNHDSFTRNS